MATFVVRHGVDLVLSGHVHSYERTHPLFKYRRDACGPIYITIGDGGNRQVRLRESGGIFLPLSIFALACPFLFDLNPTP